MQVNVDKLDYLRSKTKSRSRSVIHVAIRPSNNRYSNSKTRNQSKKTSITQPIFDRVKSSPDTLQTSEIYHKSVSHSSGSTKVDDLHQTKNDCPDWTIFEHTHFKKQKKKKTYLRPCLICFVLATCLLLTIVTIVLLVVLIKPKRSIEAKLRWNTTGITVAGVVGTPGNSADLLNLPIGVAIDWSGWVYVADSNNSRVQRYITGATAGDTVCGQANGSAGSDAFHLYFPRKLLVDSSRNIYVSDTLNNRIQYWPAGFASGMTVAGSGTAGSNNNQLYNPQAVSLDSETGLLYIADTLNNRIMCYIPGASSGTVVAGGNGPGVGQNQLDYPTGVYFDAPTKTLVIVNIGTSLLVKWKLNESEWTYVTGNVNGVSGTTSTTLNQPEGLTLDPMGDIYVADRENNRIQFFPIDQSIGITIAGVTGICGQNSTLLCKPFQVALDTQLNLYVADTYNHRIQKFLRY